MVEGGPHHPCCGPPPCNRLTPPPREGFCTRQSPRLAPTTEEAAKGWGGRQAAVAEASAPLPVKLKVTDTHPSLAPDRGTPDTTALPLK